MIDRAFITASALFFAIGAANAQGADFNSLDTDGSGGLSLEEVQAAVPTATAEEFAQYDADGSGELSEEEFTAWVAGTPPQQDY